MYHISQNKVDTIDLNTNGFELSLILQNLEFRYKKIRDAKNL